MKTLTIKLPSQEAKELDMFIKKEITLLNLNLSDI